VLSKRLLRMVWDVDLYQTSQKRNSSADIFSQDRSKLGVYENCSTPFQKISFP